jgi:hypothetical protein
VPHSNNENRIIIDINEDKTHLTATLTVKDDHNNSRVLFYNKLRCKNFELIVSRGVSAITLIRREKATTSWHQR